MQDLLCITGLKYYNDLAQPVPREEAIKIKDIVIEEVWLNEGNCNVFNSNFLFLLTEWYFKYTCI